MPRKATLIYLYKRDEEKDDSFILLFFVYNPSLTKITDISYTRHNLNQWEVLNYGNF